MKKYYLNKFVERDHTAGSKGVLDVEYFIEQISFKPLYKNKSNSKITKIKNLLANIGKLNNDTMLLVQYPIHSRFRVQELKLIRKLFNRITMVCIIQDIPSLRTDHDKIDHDMEQLNLFDHIISHNSRMSKWLADQNAKPMNSNLELFDYKVDIHSRLTNPEIKSICFAGNLIKSGFIYEWSKQLPGIKLNIYGPNYDRENLDSNTDSCSYKGSFDADILPTILEGAFGLVWDGDSLDTCSGDLGEYTRYNNPNKISLYIASGLPVIVWSEAAIAKIVDEQKIGFSIASLRDLEEKIAQIDDKTYASYVDNLKEMQKKIITGYHIKTAVNKILKDKEEKVL